MREGNDDEAVQHLLATLAVAPTYYAPYYNLARIHYKRGEYAEAEQAARNAVRLNAASAPSHDQLGLALARLNREAEALAEFRAACQVAPGDAAYLVHVAWY